MTQKLTSDQKLDQIQEILVDLVKLAGKTADNVTEIRHDITEIRHDITEIRSDVSDIQDEQESQGKKLDQLASFTHFTSGAFVA